ncbi:hypothetical protein GCM10009642_17800 [Nocardiopsis metallicus]
MCFLRSENPGQSEPHPRAQKPALGEEALPDRHGKAPEATLVSTAIGLHE